MLSVPFTTKFITKFQVSKPLKVFYIITSLYFITDGVLKIVIPLYLLKLGLNYGEIGKMLGAFGIGMILVKVFAGRHSDIIGRKAYLVFTLAFSALLKLLLIFAKNPTEFAIILMLDGVSRGLYGVIRAPLVTELSISNQRGVSFGFLNSFTILGVMIGTLSGGYFYSLDGGKIIFIVSTLILTIGSVISFIYIPNNPRISKDKQNSGFMNLLKLPPTIWALCVINFVLSATSQPFWSILLPVYITKVLGLSAGILGIIMTIDNLDGIPLSFIGGYLSDRFNSRKVFITGMFLAGSAAIFMIFFKPLFIFIIPFLLFSCFYNLTCPVLEIIESEVVRQEMKGFDFSVISISFSIGTTVGSVFFGYLMNKFNEQAGFYIVSIGLIAVSILTFGLQFIPKAKGRVYNGK